MFYLVRGMSIFEPIFSLFNLYEIEVLEPIQSVCIYVHSNTYVALEYTSK